MEEADCDQMDFLSDFPVNIEEISLIPGSLGRIRARDPKSTTYLLGLTPAPNNGTYGSLNDMLQDPPFLPTRPQEVTLPSPTSPPTTSATHHLGCSCDDENKVEEVFQPFSPGPDEGYSYNTTHLPFGRPAVLFQTDYILLHHLDFISGYSRELSMPLWTSFTLLNQDVTPPPRGSVGDCVRPDPRVLPEHSQSCTLYSQTPETRPGFLYPPEELNGVNVLVGPVFDHDYDGLRDSTPSITESSGSAPPFPSHFYTVVTSCEEVNQTVEECEGGLKVFSFLLPHRPDNGESCNSGEEESQWVEDLLALHTSRVRDVELLTGLDLLRSTNLTYPSSLGLKTYLHTFEPDD
ncbi:hypothetical protein NHX12_023230 [Muraenolepis orangiensis]|uniref:ENPP1-3/EXOG-like endonuclease/phosphodiesterase domain-containing protein n=1 Tax=Muraenolepis orangiensis TaxID=630683 RepID=A0A9Q0EJN1_9TELE|nr:hypothetical protein NHX12_023230 [Muraenolepis orangiensis]